MKDRVYVDADVILDLLAEREPHFHFAALLFSMADKAEIEAYVSPLIFSNLFYILRRLKSAAEARTILNKLNLIVTILPVNGRIIQMALASDFSDFEDAIQYYTATENAIPYLITRNKRHYQKSAIPVYTAEEFLTSRKSNE